MEANSGFVVSWPHQTAEPSANSRREWEFWGTGREGSQRHRDADRRLPLPTATADRDHRDYDRRPRLPTSTADLDRRPRLPTATADLDRRPRLPTSTADRDRDL
jgi:hypothetical protein